MIPALSLINTFFSQSRPTLDENMDSFNSSRWHKADGWSNGNPFNCGWRADEVTFNNGFMTLELNDDGCPQRCSGKPYASGEYRTNEFYGYGLLESRIKAAKGDGLVSSLFFYTGPSDNNPWDEIDIEILGKDPTKMQINYYTNGTGNHEKIIDLGFDASKGFHTYGIKREKNAIRWYVDGKLVHTETGSRGQLPAHPARIMMNLWPGTGVDGWLNPFKYKGPVKAEYDWVRFTPPESTPAPAVTPAPKTVSISVPEPVPSLPQPIAPQSKHYIEPAICSEKGCKIGPQPGILQGHFATDEPDHDTIRKFEETFRQKVDIVLRFINFDSGMFFPEQAARTAAANNAVLLIKVEPFSGERYPDDPFNYIEKINAGAFDKMFRTLGEQIRAFGGPVMLTFGHEMNIEDESGRYPWAGLRTYKDPDKEEDYRKAFVRFHDLVEGAGANNVTWVLNFDAGVYHPLTMQMGEQQLTNHIYERLNRFVPYDPKNPNKSYFDIVAVDGYVNDNYERQNTGNPDKVVQRLFDPIFSAISRHPRMKDKELMIGECGVSLGKGMTKDRKASMLTAILDYIANFNSFPTHPKKIMGYIYFDVNKTSGGDQGYWKLSTEEDKKAYQGWLASHSQLFKDPIIFYQKDTPNVPISFTGPTYPIPRAKIDLAKMPEKQLPPKDTSLDQLIPLPKDLIIGKYNYRLGLALLDRWQLDKYIDREKDNGNNLLEAGINALLKLDPKTPLTFSLRSMDDYAEIKLLSQTDHNRPMEIALASYFDNPKGYWENAITFVSVYAQKAVETQNRGNIARAVKVCELLLGRYNTQKKLESGQAEEVYAYPSAHNLGLLQLTLADATSQLKKLSESSYQESIQYCLNAIELFQKLESKGLVPSGSDYFSISKALITTGDLKVRIAQIYTRKMDFNTADRLFREAEKFYQAVANIDAGREKGIKIDNLKLEVGVDAMLTSWKNNLSKGYIRYNDKLRGFQGTFHYLKALASIKVEGTFLENPTKSANDYEMEGLFVRLTTLQNSLKELTRDPSIKTDFIEGLAIITKANLLLMIADRAQYETSSMDRASALEYFRQIITKINQLVPETAPSASELQARMEANKDVIKKRAKRPLTIEDDFLIDGQILNFKSTAAASKRFALIMSNLASYLAGKVYDKNKTLETEGNKYLFVLANLMQADMAVRTFYVDDLGSTGNPKAPINVPLNLARIKAARQHMEPDEDWFQFQTDFLEASVTILGTLSKTDVSRGIEILNQALIKLKKFIPSSQTFYKTQIYLLQGEGYITTFQFPKATAIITEGINPMLDSKYSPNIFEVSKQIGWNLKDFWIRYSRIYINSVNQGAAIEKFIPY